MRTMKPTNNRVLYIASLPNDQAVLGRIDRIAKEAISSGLVRPSEDTDGNNAINHVMMTVETGDDTVNGIMALIGHYAECNENIPESLDDDIKALLKLRDWMDSIDDIRSLEKLMPTIIRSGTFRNATDLSMLRDVLNAIGGASCRELSGMYLAAYGTVQDAVANGLISELHSLSEHADVHYLMANRIFNQVTAVVCHDDAGILDAIKEPNESKDTILQALIMLDDCVNAYMDSDNWYASFRKHGRSVASLYGSFLELSALYPKWDGDDIMASVPSMPYNGNPCNKTMQRIWFVPLLLMDEESVPVMRAMMRNRCGRVVMTGMTYSVAIPESIIAAGMLSCLTGDAGIMDTIADNPVSDLIGTVHLDDATANRMICIGANGWNMLGYALHLVSLMRGMETANSRTYDCVILRNHGFIGTMSKVLDASAQIYDNGSIDFDASKLQWVAQAVMDITGTSGSSQYDTEIASAELSMLVGDVPIMDAMSLPYDVWHANEMFASEGVSQRGIMHDEALDE